VSTLEPAKRRCWIRKSGKRNNGWIPYTYFCMRPSWWRR